MYPSDYDAVMQNVFEFEILQIHSASLYSSLKLLVHLWIIDWKHTMKQRSACYFRKQFSPSFVTNLVSKDMPEGCRVNENYLLCFFFLKKKDMLCLCRVGLSVSMTRWSSLLGRADPADGSAPHVHREVVLLAMLVGPSYSPQSRPAACYDVNDDLEAALPAYSSLALTGSLCCIFF